MFKLGDMIMGMSFVYGGYLMYGLLVNMLGKWFNVVSYGLNENEDIDYDVVEKLVNEYKLKLIVVGVLVFVLKIDFECLVKIVKLVGVYLMVDMVYYVGLIVVGVYLNLVLYVDFVMMMMYKSLCGLCGGVILMKVEYEKLINLVIFLGI